MNKTDTDISKDNNEILIRIDERQKEISKDLVEIKNKLFGNGHEGMCAEFIQFRTTLHNVKWGIALGFTIITIIIAVLNYFKV